VLGIHQTTFAGYPKKKVFSSLVRDDEIINGEVIANKINDACLYHNYSRNVPLETTSH
jgi:hypothetical protein